MKGVNSTRPVQWLAPIIWRAHIRSLHNMLRYDNRMRVGLGFTLAFAIVSGLWSAVQLTAQIHLWQVQGAAALTSGLWLYCISVWSGMIFFVAIGIQTTVGRDEVVLQCTLPLPIATRFRALVGAFFVENLWLLLLFQALIMGYVLFSTLGSLALPWLLLLQLGVMLSVCLSLIMTLLILRYLVPRGHIKLRVVTALGLALLALLAAIYHIALAEDINNTLHWLRPEIAIGLCALLLFIVLGPGAHPLGGLYMATLLVLQGSDRARKAFTLPGAGLLKRLFARHRTLTGALFTRAATSQGRNLFFWGRIAMTWVLLALFPLLHSTLRAYGFNESAQVAGCAGLLACIHILETAPGAVSSEASRLALFLSAPFSSRQILRAKLTLFLLPVLCEGVTMGLYLCWRFSLSPAQIGLVVVTLSEIILGGTSLLVLGSAWDMDLNLSVEGMRETLLVEEGPFTPRKMVLFNACLLFLASATLLLWRLPLPVVAGLLGVLDIGIVTGMLRFGQGQLVNLVQKG